MTKNYGGEKLIGKGIYARYDGYQVWIGTMDYEYPTDHIAIDPEIWKNLVQYVEKLQEKGAMK